MRSSIFTGNEAYPYSPGSLFLGVDFLTSAAVGIRTERHAITIAGSRAGKGAAIIIPNLLRWTHNALVIDPKGEAAQQTAEAREAMGQAVHVLDPFGVAKVPDRFRASFNPLLGIDPNAIDAREEIGVITDGLVIRSDSKAAHWDDGGAAMIAGCMAYLRSEAPAESCTLPELRFMLTLPDEKLVDLAGEMQECSAFGRLPAAAAATLLATGNERQYFRSVALRSTSWLDSPAIAKVLTRSTFDLADLKTKPCTVYLVLPPKVLAEHARFLRLFVRMALNVMMKDDVKDGRRCLFLLDEFYSLGRIDEIAKAAGLMPGYGVTLMPVLQDIGQLESLYGREGMHTYFGNSDAHIFFGNTDAPTLDYISQRMGKVSVNDVAAPPMKTKGFKRRDTLAAVRQELLDENAWRTYQREASTVGSARMPPDEVRQWVMKGDDAVARGMIVFAKGNAILHVRLAPYFLDFEPLRLKYKNRSRIWEAFTKLHAKGGDAFIWVLIFGALGISIYVKHNWPFGLW